MVGKGRGNWQERETGRQGVTQLKTATQKVSQAAEKERELNWERRRNMENRLTELPALNLYNLHL